MPLSYCSFVMRYDSCAVFSVFCVTEKPIVVGEHRQILVRHRRNQRDLRRLARFRSRQILRERLILQAPDAPEEVDFPRRVQADRIRRSRSSGRRTTDSSACAACVCDAARVERREQAGARDLILRARRLDVEHRHAQVAIVLQRELDDLLQARIGEEIAPADIRRALPVRAAAVARARTRVRLVRVHAAFRKSLRDGRGRAARISAGACSPRRIPPRLPRSRNV